MYIFVSQNMKKEVIIFKKYLWVANFNILGGENE